MRQKLMDQVTAGPSRDEPRQHRVDLAEQARANHRDLVLTTHLAGDESGLVITRAGGGDVFGCGRCAGHAAESPGSQR